MVSSLPRCLVLTQMLLVVTGCSEIPVSTSTGSPQVFILHDPIQPGATEPVRYDVQARDSTGIKTIEIWEEQRSLQPCSSGDNQPPCSTITQAARVLKTCPFIDPLPTLEICYVVGGPYVAGTNYVGYKATVTNGANITASEGFIYYARGTYPWSQTDPIPIYISGDASNRKVDLVFIPDSDYTTSYPAGWQGPFMRDVTLFVKNAYLSESMFSSETRTRRGDWNFYITYEQGDAVGCLINEPPNYDVMRETVNVGFVLHNEDLWDCSQLLADGSLFSAEVAAYVIGIHELGHAVYTLADEYCGGALFQNPEKPNVFTDRRVCGSNKCNAAFSCASFCDRWAKCEGPTDLMASPYSINNGFDQCDKARIQWKHDRCALGLC